MNSRNELPPDDGAGLGGLGGERERPEQAQLADEPAQPQTRLDKARHRANVRFWASQDRHPYDGPLLEKFEAEPLFPQGTRVRIEENGAVNWEVLSTANGKVTVQRPPTDTIDGQFSQRTIDEVILAELNPEE